MANCTRMHSGRIRLLITFFLFNCSGPPRFHVLNCGVTVSFFWFFLFFFVLILFHSIPSRFFSSVCVCAFVWLFRSFLFESHFRAGGACVWCWQEYGLDLLQHCSRTWPAYAPPSPNVVHPLVSEHPMIRQPAYDEQCRWNVFRDVVEFCLPLGV